MGLTLERPRRFRETRTRFDHFLPLRFREADVDLQNRSVRTIIITEGLGNLRDKNFYTPEAINSIRDLFNKGKQFYIDHPSESEESDRPERSVRDLAGYFYDTKVGTVKDPDTGEDLTACFATLKFDESETGDLAFGKVKTAVEFQRRFPNSKDVYAGISINGGGLSHTGTIRGIQVNVVTEIQEVFSADIVTKPARGGRFLALVQEAERMSAWKRHARESGHHTTRTGSHTGGKRVMPTIVKESDKKKRAKEAEDALRGKLADKLQKLKATMDAGGGMGPEDIANDIKMDVDELVQSLTGGPAEDDEEEARRAAAGEGAEAEGGEEEAEAEGGEEEAEAGGGEEEGG